APTPTPAGFDFLTTPNCQAVKSGVNHTITINFAVNKPNPAYTAFLKSGSNTITIKTYGQTANTTITMQATVAGKPKGWYRAYLQAWNNRKLVKQISFSCYLP
ncbi:MAG: hypothetical protein GXP43_01045, partial [bacterium]|nr:hypothetical protein [bacterium]